MGGILLTMITYQRKNFCGELSERGASYATGEPFRFGGTMAADEHHVSWDVADNCVWFEITHAGKVVACRIDGDTLWKYFEAQAPTETFARPAFTQYEKAIRAVAVGKVAHGEFDSHPKRPEGIVWLRGRDVAADG
jgi:hypothetical protein